MIENERCENCAYCIPMPLEEFTCDNENSEGYGLSIAYDDRCEEFEEREEERA